jgi:hypothetical protein
MAATRVRPGWVRITCDDPAANLVLRLGTEPPKVTGGLGGWEVTARPRQVAMTTWAGTEPFQVSLSLMLDGYAADSSVERSLRRLVTVARGDDESPPGVVRVTGIPLPVEAGWVLEAVEFADPILRGTATRNGASGERLRQPLTLTLREYVPPSYLQLRKGALAGAKTKTRVVTARKGETVAHLARRQHCKWTELRALNPKLIRKANQALKAGTKVRAPVAQHKAKHHPATKHRSHR